MTTFTNPAYFFHDLAAQHNGHAEITDPLERAILASQRKDAAIAKRALQWFADFLTKSEDRADDRLEQAILACQRRDAAVVRHALGA